MTSSLTFVCLIIVVCLPKGLAVFREKRKVCPPMNLCDFQPESACLNGATCRRDENTCFYYCICPPGYTGKKCQSSLPEETFSSNSTCEEDGCTTNNLCLNGGTCVWNATACTAACACAYNFSGDTCSESNPGDQPPSSSGSGQPCPIDYCLGKPCINGGTCVLDSQCQIHCKCTLDVTGGLCEFPLTTTSEGQNGSTTVAPTQRTLRPISERSCGGGYVCLHGRCERKEDGSVMCDCDNGFIGTFCHIPCELECGENGSCDRANRTAPTRCQCKHPYTGPTCEDIIPEAVSSAEWKYWIVGSCLVLLVVFGLLLLVAFILMKKRNIFIMQVLYYFQPYEDDDGKLFDAFISYKSDPEDERFVYRTIYPELEVKRGYKLCLHQRDFLVGETIANNILWAIENSRRTILVMSPHYMKSDFTRFEYQVAHNEMLKQKHKVIPLLLEDISQQKDLMDPTLNSILKSITYIEWPKDGIEEDTKKFWRRMELSLPKTKSRPESPSSDSFPVLSFDNSAFTSVPNDLEMISVETKNTELPNTETPQKDSDKIVYDTVTKETDSENNLSNEGLKSSDKPNNDELFNKMRDKALEYETCLDV